MKFQILGILIILTCFASSSFSETSLSPITTSPVKRNIDSSVDRKLPVTPRCRVAADLAITQILDPIFEQATGNSIVKVRVKNIGGIAANSFIMTYSDGTINKSVTLVGLAVGVTKQIVFKIPYWVYRPDAYFTIKADSSNRIRECDEKNNSKTFFGLG